MWLWLIHMKPLERSTVLMGELPASGAVCPVSAFWLTGIQRSTVSRSLQQKQAQHAAQLLLNVEENHKVTK